MTNRLTKIFDSSDPTRLEDYLSCLMAAIEDSLIQSKFIIGVDYTRKDLLNAALPLVSQAFAKGTLAFNVGWPASLCEEQRKGRY